MSRQIATVARWLEAREQLDRDARAEDSGGYPTAPGRAMYRARALTHASAAPASNHSYGASGTWNRIASALTNTVEASSSNPAAHTKRGDPRAAPLIAPSSASSATSSAIRNDTRADHS